MRQLTGGAAGLQSDAPCKKFTFKVLPAARRRVHVVGTVPGGDVATEIMRQAALAKFDGIPVDKMFVVVADAEGSTQTDVEWPDGSKTTLRVPGAKTVNAFMHPERHASGFLVDELYTLIDKDRDDAITSARMLLCSPDHGNPIKGLLPFDVEGKDELRSLARQEKKTGEIIVESPVRQYLGAECRILNKRMGESRYEYFETESFFPDATRQAYAAANGLPSSLSNKDYAWAQKLDAALVDPMTSQHARDYRHASDYAPNPTTDTQRAKNLISLRNTRCAECIPANYARANGLPDTLTVAQCNLARALDATYEAKLAEHPDNAEIAKAFDYKAHEIDDPATPTKKLGWNDAAKAGFTDEHAWHLWIMHDCAMKNLFAADPETVTFSLGFVVAGPHASLIAMAELFRR
jgi:hypothetical protein